MRTSDKIDQIATALNKAQSAVEGAKKNKANPHFRSNYADLASVWDACREALTENGLSVVQAGAITDTGHPVLVTRLMHSSGQWIEGEFPLFTAQNTAQALGSAITYARRYGLAAIVGVAPDDDDDGQLASTKPVMQVANQLNQRKPKTDEKQALIDGIKRMVKEKGIDASTFAELTGYGTSQALFAQPVDVLVDAHKTISGYVQEAA